MDRFRNGSRLILGLAVVAVLLSAPASLVSAAPSDEQRTKLKSAEGRLKGLVTSEYQLIEVKGVDQFKSPNYVRLMMTSNEAWVVPAGKDERRFAFFGQRVPEEEEEETGPLSKIDRDTAHVISRNLEKSRQIHHYRGLYIAAAVLASKNAKSLRI